MPGLRLLILCLCLCSPICAQSQPEQAAPQSITVALSPAEQIELLRISAGAFTQGSPDSETGRENDESSHQVTLTRDYYIAKFPVTVGQFKLFVAETGYKTEAEQGTSGGYGWSNGKLEQRPEFNWRNPGHQITDQHPVTIVTVADAIEFNKWLSRKAARTFQLPTEAQWEYACRAGTTTPFYTGQDDAAMDQIGWTSKNAAAGPSAVGQKQPNAWGLFDMSGNVYEWCSDFYAPYPTGAVVDPQVRSAPTGETARIVLRGGSFTRLPKRCRSAARYRATAGTRNAENGFRVVSFVTQSSAPAVSTNANPTTAAPSLAGNSPNGTQAESPAAVDNQNAQSHAADAHDAAPANPVVAESRPAQRGTLGAACGAAFLLVSFVGVGILVMVLLSRKGKSSRTNDLAPSRAFGGYSTPMPLAPFETAQDGFWLNTSDFLLGSQLFYHYFADGQRHHGNCLVDHNQRQFVYTGNAPDRISIDRVQAPDDERAGQTDPFIPPMLDANASLHSANNDRYDASPDQHLLTPEESPDQHLLSDDDRSGFPPAY